MKTAFKTTFHRNGDVTYWNIYRQQWERRHATEIPDRIIATFSLSFWKRCRRAIARAAGGEK